MICLCTIYLFFCWVERGYRIIALMAFLNYASYGCNTVILNHDILSLTQLFLQLVDFESWKTIIARSEKNSSAIDSNGDVCVLPRSFEARHLDIKGNVYAFGVLLLEIVSGRTAFSKDTGSLVEWV